MKNKVTLKEIHKDNKAINRNLQRIANIMLIGLLGRMAEKAKEANDSGQDCC